MVIIFLWWRSYFCDLNMWFRCNIVRKKDASQSLACSAGILMGWPNLTRSQSIFWTSHMFNLELEWTVGVGGGGRARRQFSPPYPYPSPYFWSPNTPWVQISFSPQPYVAIKMKMAAIIFVMKILCSLLPKLFLLFRLVTHWGQRVNEQRTGEYFN